MILIPDSSFFICFMDDLNDLLPTTERYGFLYSIVTAFRVVVGNDVRTEVSWGRIPDKITTASYHAESIFSTGDVDPVITQLRLLLGKGEVEVIGNSKKCLVQCPSPFLFVLDDGTARKLVLQFVPELKNYMVGTIGLCSRCAQQNIYSVEKTINILEMIGNSSFHIKPELLSPIILELKKRCEQ